MNESELIERFADALSRDPNAVPPPDLDAETVEALRALALSERAATLDSQTQTRMWQRALTQAHAQGNSSGGRRRGQPEERVTILRPHEHIQMGDEDMNATYNDAIVPARPAQYSGTRRLRFDPLTWAAAIAAMLVIGAMLLAMMLATRPGEPGVPEMLPLAVQQVDCNENVDHLGVGQMFFDRGDYETAILEFTCAIEADPSNYEAYLARGEANLLAGDMIGSLLDYFLVALDNPEMVEEAIARYTRAIEANPDDVTAYMLRAGVYLATWQDSSQFAADCSRIVELNSELWFGHLCLGLTYGSPGQAQQARDEFEIALELAPNNPSVSAMIGLSYSYSDSNMAGLALEHVNRAIQLDPEQPVYYYLRALVYHEAGELTLAAEAVAQAIELTQSEMVIQNVELEEVTTLPLSAGRVYSIPFQAQAGQRVTITAAPQVEGFPLSMVLLAEDGTPLISGFGEENSLSTGIYRYALPGDGTYTVLITGTIPSPEVVIRLKMWLRD